MIDGASLSSVLRMTHHLLQLYSQRRCCECGAGCQVSDKCFCYHKLGNASFGSF